MFVAKKDFQCGICDLLIPKGSVDFRFLRKAGNEWVAIHATCKGKEAKTKAMPEVSPVPTSPTDKLYEAFKGSKEWNPAKAAEALKEMGDKLATATAGDGEAPKNLKEYVFKKMLENPEYAEKYQKKDKEEPKQPEQKKEKPEAASSGIEQAIKDLIAKTAVQAELDEKKVREICKEEIQEKTLPRAVEFKIDDAPKVNVKLAHKTLESLVKLVSIRNNAGHRFNVYLHGPAGSGKSSGARQVKDILNAERYGYISLNPQTPDSRLLGFIHAGGQYVESEFYRCYTMGGVFCIDEIDNASASLLTTLNGLLENGHAAFPHGVYPRHEDFVCIATANTIGRGGDIQYPERRALDGATLERFVFLEWGYDDAMTRAIVGDIVGDKADDIIKWVNETGRNLKSKYPTLIVSPRAYIHSAVLERNGFNRETIKQMVIARGVK
jgi:hypothetical protein